MCPCKIHKDSSELWIMWSSVTERLIVESPSWRINPSQRTQTLQLPRVCIKRRIRQINPRYKRWCDAAEIICERSPSIKCTAEMLIDEGAESKQQSRGSFINAKQKAAAAAPRICSSAESESVRSCCGTHVGMCPACVSVLHPQGSLVHFCFGFFELIFWVLKRWACPLLTESSLSWCEGRALVFWVWRRNGWCRHEWDKSKRVLLLCWKYKLIIEYGFTQTEKKKGSRVSKMSEYGLYLKIIPVTLSCIILNISMHIVVVFECRVDYLYLWRTISKAAVLEYLQYTQYIYIYTGLWWNGRFTSRMCSRHICSKSVVLSYQYWLKYHINVPST